MAVLPLIPLCSQSLFCALGTSKIGIYPSSRWPRKADDRSQQGGQEVPYGNRRNKDGWETQERKPLSRGGRASRDECKAPSVWFKNGCQYWGKLLIARVEWSSSFGGSPCYNPWTHSAVGTELSRPSFLQRCTAINSSSCHPTFLPPFPLQQCLVSAAFPNCWQRKKL